MSKKMEVAERFGNVAAMPLTFLGYIALARSIWPAHVHFSGDTISWPAIVAILLVAVGGLTLLTQILRFRMESREPTGANLSIVSRENSQPDGNAERSRALFDLGTLIGKLHQFDPDVLSDAHQRCEALGLDFSASKIGRVLDMWDRDYERMIEDGGTVSDRTLQMFRFQMTEIEDAIYADIARTKQTDLTPQRKMV